MQDDPWLDRWLPQICVAAGGLPVLELGCGDGADTATLTAAELAVVALDVSAAAIARARDRVPAAHFHVQDVRAALPEQVQDTGVIIASLSLHYFSWAETVALFARLRQTLRPGCLFVCRLNSTLDVHFGASGHPEIEPGFYLVDGQPKRFFDAAAINRLLADGWQRLALEHQWTGKYGPPKALWELVCRRPGADTTAETAP
jgi:SAM-dependent methyltransferase